MSVPRTLLGLLEVRPRHGYDLKRAYDARFAGDKPIKAGQVYSTLARLLRDGLVEPVGTDQQGGPERTTYAVTEAGTAELATWLTTPEDPSTYLQSDVFTKVVLALLSGRSPVDVLDAQRASHLAVMRDLTARKSGAGPADSLALDYALFHLDADIRWVEHTTARLDRLAAGLLDASSPLEPR